MKKDIKNRWIAALLSGNYAKVNCSLRTKNGFCATGVLCDVVGDGRWVSGADGKFTYVTPKGGVRTNKFGKAGRKALHIARADQDKVIDMNDRGSTFTQIAAYLKSVNLETNYKREQAAR